MERIEPDELSWLAFRYVAGEMNAAEAQGFESRLADDQDFRDAVCHAVALTDGLAASPPAVGAGDCDGPPTVVALPAKDNRWRQAALRALAWMSVGAAAAVVGIVLARPGLLRQPGTNDPTAANPARPVANAVVWARLQTASQWADEQDERFLEEAEFSVPAEGADFERAYPSPTWLHVSEMQKRATP